MTMNTIRLMLALVGVAITSGITSSEGTLASGQKSSGASDLNGTSWQLVKFQGADDTTLVPDDQFRSIRSNLGRDGR